MGVHFREDEEDGLCLVTLSLFKPGIDAGSIPLIISWLALQVHSHTHTPHTNLEEDTTPFPGAPVLSPGLGADTLTLQGVLMW